MYSLNKKPYLCSRNWLFGKLVVWSFRFNYLYGHRQLSQTTKLLNNETTK